MTYTKKVKKKISLTEGNVYIHASFNNTIITLTDKSGNVIGWSSAGSKGFKWPKRSTPYAASVVSADLIEQALPYGLITVDVFVKWIWAGREQAIRAIIAKWIQVENIVDVTPVPHNGCRRKGVRSV